MRSYTEILKKSFTILILADRGLLENEKQAGIKYSIEERENQKNKFIDIINNRNLVNDLSKPDKEILHTPIGHLDKNIFQMTQWQYEAIPVLLWSVSLEEYPQYDGKVSNVDYHKILGKYGTSDFKYKINLKDKREIEIMCEVSMLWHWRAREGNKKFKKDIKTIITSLFGKEYQDYFDYIPSSKNDFLVNKTEYSVLDKNIQSYMKFISKWRHHALEWIIGNDSWDDTDTST